LLKISWLLPINSLISLKRTISNTEHRISNNEVFDQGINQKIVFVFLIFGFYYFVIQYSAFDIRFFIV